MRPSGALRGVVIIGLQESLRLSRSRRGGTEVAALFYSLCETAKLNKLDPASYHSQIAPSGNTR